MIVIIKGKGGRKVKGRGKGMKETERKREGESMT